MKFFSFPFGKKNDSNLKLKFESEKTTELDSLNKFIKDFKFNNMTMTKYDEYLKIQESILSKYNQSEYFRFFRRTK